MISKSTHRQMKWFQSRSSLRLKKSNVNIPTIYSIQKQYSKIYCIDSEPLSTCNKQNIHGFQQNLICSLKNIKQEKLNIQTQNFAIQKIDLNKKVSMASTIDLEKQLQNDSILQLSQSQKHDQLQFSFGPISISNYSSEKCQSILQQKINELPNILTNRQKHQFLTKSIKQYREQQQFLFQNKRQIKLIKIVLRYFISNLRSLQDLKELDVINCFRYLQFAPVLERYKQLSQLMKYLFQNQNQGKISTTIFLKYVFLMLEWDFETYNNYFWLEAQVNALQNQMFYQKAFPLPHLNQCGMQQCLSCQFSNHYILIFSTTQSLKFRGFLSKQKINQVMIIIDNTSDDPLKLTKKSITFSPWTVLQLNNFLGISTSSVNLLNPEFYQVKVKIHSRDICLQFQVSSSENLPDIVDELRKQYLLDEYDCAQILKQLQKEVSQLNFK